MATIEEMNEQFFTFISKTFNVPMSVFVWPAVLFNFIIPLASMVIIWYSILHKGVRIFHKEFVNFILAILFAIFTVPFVIYVPANLMLTIAIMGYFLIDRHLSFKKIAFAVFFGIGVFLIYNFAYSYFPQY